MPLDQGANSARNGQERGSGDLGVEWILRVFQERPLACELRSLGTGRESAVRETTPALVSLAARALERGASGLRHILPYQVSLEGVATLRRGLSLLRPEVEVLDPAGAPLGRLRQRLWASGGSFEALDARGRRLAVLRLTAGAAVLEGQDGRPRAEMRPARGPERTIRLEGALDAREAALLLAALAALDRVLEG